MEYERMRLFQNIPVILESDGKKITLYMKGGPKEEYANETNHKV